MPQPFNTAVMTAEGEALLARATAGECSIEYVCMAVGNGVYTHPEKSTAALKERTELKSLKNEYKFSNVVIENRNCVILTALITNQDPTTLTPLVTEGYYINEVGIFAKEKGEADDTAILYSVCVTASASGDGDYMPPYNGYNRAEITQNYLITVDNSAEITVQVKGAALLVEDALILVDLDMVEEAFRDVYHYVPASNQTVMSAADIVEAVNTEWNGETSEDPMAMSANDVEEAVNTKWNGETSEDPTALSNNDVEEVTR